MCTKKEKKKTKKTDNVKSPTNTMYCRSFTYQLTNLLFGVGEQQSAGYLEN